MQTPKRILIPVIVLLSLVAGFYPVPSQAMPSLIDADPPPVGESANPADLPVENSDWWATVQEDLRQSEYKITWQEHTYLAELESAYQAPNRANNLRAYFTPDGLTIIPRVWPEAGEIPPWRWELSLMDGSGAALPAAEQQVQDNNITYQRPEMDEWYRNDEAGLRQGFTLAAPLGGQSGEPLQLDLQIGGNLNAEIIQDGAAAEFRNPDGEGGLRYGSLHASDAAGRSLPFWLELRDTTLSIFVDAAGTKYPIRIEAGITGLSEDPDWFVEADQFGIGDRLGASVSTAGDVNGDGYSDVLVGMPDYDGGPADVGAVFAYYGSASGLATEYSWMVQSDQAEAHFGEAVAPAGDINGDGYGDVIIGAPDWDDGQTDEGGVWLYLGSSSGLGIDPWDYQDGGQAGAAFGFSVATAGDVNGDGYSDVIVGAYYYSNGEDDEGRAYVWYGGTDKPFDHVPDWRAEGNQMGAWMGYSVSTAGDVNGDGYSDVIVGSLAYDNGQINDGAAFVWHGSADGLNEGVHGDPSNAAWEAQGNQGGANLGLSVSIAGDVNGDGYADVIVGGPWYNNGQVDEGVAWVFLGSDTGLDTDWVSCKESNQTGAHLGYSVAAAGDVNGDGYADIIVGAYAFDGIGRAWVWYGSSSGPSSLSNWHADGDWEFAWFGAAVATAGDVNGDGYSDIIVGAPGYVGSDLLGYVNVYHGGPSALSGTSGWSRDSNQEGAEFGYSLGTAGDVNGDGYADVVIGAPYWDGGEADEGGIWLYRGGASGLSPTSDWHAESDQAEAGFGRSVGAAGDVNGDGYSDIIVSAYLYDQSYTDEGMVFVYYGSNDGPGAVFDWSHSSNREETWYGYSVSTAGDVNGDGYSDVIVGVPYWYGDQTIGSAWVYHGSAEGLSISPDWQSAIEGSDGIFGYSVSTAGDVNGDGYSDVIIGTPYWDDGQDNEGGAWVYHGSAEGLQNEFAWHQESDRPGAYFGESVGTAGDVNGDGYADVIVGAYRWSDGEDGEGRASVYHGSANGLDQTPGWERESNQPDAYFGVSVGTAGDVNGDGYSDIIVGANYWTGGEDKEGSAWVYHGTASGLNYYSDWHDESNQAGAGFGSAVGSAGDVNGDGYADILIGIPNYDNPTNSEGMAFLYYGNGGPGVSLLPRQRQAEDGSPPLAQLGLSRNSHRFTLDMLRKNPFGSNGMVFYSEVKEFGVVFDGSASTTQQGYVSANGERMAVVVDVEPDTTYHWRLRWRYDPVTTPWMPASRWVTMPWNGWNEADFRTEAEPAQLGAFKRVEPETNVTYHGAVTYTIELHNGGGSSATDITLTDTLPASVDFSHWIHQPTGAEVNNDVITWQGTLGSMGYLELVFVATHTGNFGDVITNTVQYTSPSGSGSDMATFRLIGQRIYLPLITR